MSPARDNTIMGKNEQLSLPQGQIVNIDWDKLVSDNAPDSEYPVDFEYLWLLLGYSEKGKAVRALRARFIEGAEFCLPEMASKTKGSGGHNKRRYWLTEGCAKEFCLVAGTDQGKAVRRYFIAREKQAKRLIKERKEALAKFAEKEARLWERERRLKAAEDRKRARLALEIAASIGDEEVQRIVKHRALKIITGAELPNLLPASAADDKRHLGAADAAKSIGFYGPSGKPNGGTFGKVAKALDLQTEKAIEQELVSCRRDRVETPKGEKEQVRFFYGPEAIEQIRKELVRRNKIKE